MSTPRQDGLHMPAEWAEHAGCWMAWPINKTVWGARLDAARDAYTEVAKAIAEFEPVTMIVAPEHTASASMRCGKGCSMLTLTHDDSWTRDTGPTFVVDAAGNVAGVDWRFNAWGEKYPNYRHDAALAKRLLDQLGMRRYAPRLVMEGGALHVDGEGTVLVTEQCLLNPNRNPRLDRAAIEKHLLDYLGAEKVIWLAGGLEDDETDGHVDNVACFVRPGVVLALTAAQGDGNHPMLKENLTRLRAASDARGRSLEVIEVAQPAKRVREADGRRLPVSYVNFYLANGAVIAPLFDDSADGAAITILKDAFPDRALRPIDALDIVFGGGGIHCITQQQPAGPPLPPV